MLINNIRKSPTFPIRNTIHAPTRGATFYIARWSRISKISIHAPTRGATFQLVPVFIVLSDFNPRSYKRSDDSAPNNGISFSIHAPTRGATVSGWRENSHRNNFNPRSYKRSDVPGYKFMKNWILFQSTLLQEERRTDDHAGQICSAFQSTLLQEERQWTLQPNLLMLPISIHAPTRGATFLGWFGVHKFYISIHAPTRGATAF